MFPTRRDFVRAALAAPFLAGVARAQDSAKPSFPGLIVRAHEPRNLEFPVSELRDPIVPNEHFFVPTPANTGLRDNKPSADGGVGDVTLRPMELGSFKSPSLRNVAVTAPYGHDGRFATLDALIDHYSANAILDPNLGYMIPVGPLKFTTSERAALIAFLNTLTDQTLLTDPRFSNPFVK